MKRLAVIALFLVFLITAPVAARDPDESVAERAGAAGEEHPDPRPSVRGDGCQLLLGLAPREGVEHSPQAGGDFAPESLAWHVGLGVALQVELAALPGNRRKHRAAGLPQAAVIVADQKPYPT